MYPLQMYLTDGIGFAVANDEAEHRALIAAGYGPGLPEDGQEAAEIGGQTIESVRAALDAAGIAYSKRLGLEKLLALLPKE